MAEKCQMCLGTGYRSFYTRDWKEFTIPCERCQQREVLIKPEQPEPQPDVNLEQLEPTKLEVQYAPNYKFWIGVVVAIFNTSLFIYCCFLCGGCIGNSLKETR